MKQSILHQQKNIRQMKNLKKLIEKSVSDNITDYFAGLISSDDFIELYIEPLIDLSKEKKDEIRGVLIGFYDNWQTADCDEDGPSFGQHMALEIIIGTASNIISNICVS